MKGFLRQNIRTNEIFLLFTKFNRHRTSYWNMYQVLLLEFWGWYNYNIVHEFKEYIV